MGAPPLPILPNMAGAPRPTGVLAAGGRTSSIDPNAINSFVSNYLLMKQSAKDTHAQQFQAGVAAAAQGIPVDNEAIMKHGKKAGMDWLPTEPPTPEQQQAKQEQMQMTSALLTQQQQAQAGPMGGQGGNIAPPQPPQLPPGQAPFQPNLGQKILQGLGGGSQAPVSNQSPTGQWLTSLQQAGSQGGGMTGQLGRQNALQEMMDHLKAKGIDVQGMSQDQQAQFMGLVKSAVNNQDPQATESLVRLGLFKDIPLDEFTAAMRRISPELPQGQIDKNAASAYMYAKMGGPQLRLAQMGMAKDMLPFMGNDMGKSLQYIQGIFTGQDTGITPQMSADQYKQLMDGMSTLTKAYPTAPMNLINAISHAQVVGSQDTAQQLMGVLKDYPREGTLDYTKHQQTLGYDYSTLAQRTQNEAGLLNLSTVQALSGKDQSAFDNWFKLATNKDLDPTGDATRSAFDAMANSMSRDAQLKINYRGQEIPMGPQEVQSLRNWRPTWPGGKPYLAPAQTPQNLLNQFTQKPAGGLKEQLSGAEPDKITQIIQDYANKNLTSPNASDRVQALSSVVQTLARMPPSTRQLLVKQMDIPADMKAALSNALNAMK
jgi:hypothetical protein